MCSSCYIGQLILSVTLHKSKRENKVCHCCLTRPPPKKIPKHCLTLNIFGVQKRKNTWIWEITPEKKIDMIDMKIQNSFFLSREETKYAQAYFKYLILFLKSKLEIKKSWWKGKCNPRIQWMKCKLRQAEDIKVGGNPVVSLLQVRSDFGDSLSQLLSYFCMCGCF